MTKFTELDLLRELEPVVAENLNRHLVAANTWNPHDYVPWAQGRNYAAQAGSDWQPEDTKLSKVARVALLVNLLTEDNLPSYHREIAQNFSMDGAWGTWVNRWTAEENRHGIAIRDYLVVTRSVDPVHLEQARLKQMTAGFTPGHQGQAVLTADRLFDSVAYVTFQELATRVSHRNTGIACAEPHANALLRRVAADENLHMLFYRNVMTAGLELAPDQAVESIWQVLSNFSMPGYNMPDFRRNAVAMAVGGIYDTRQHLDDVVLPVLRKWRIFERTDFTGEGARYVDLIGEMMQNLEGEAKKFEESKARYLEREERKAAARAS